MREVLRIEQPYDDHNVGQIAFNPNSNPEDPDYGLLYIAMGDGGNFGCCPLAAVDPHFVGQDRSSPLGTLLRFDPLEAEGGAAYQIPADNPFATDGDPDTLGEIYAYGPGGGSSRSTAASLRRPPCVRCNWSTRLPAFSGERWP